MDYRKFKTPFFEINIADSTGSKSVSLPHHILRLVQKIEILESFQKDNYSTMTITFAEGSREPGSPDTSAGTSGLYQLASPSDTSSSDFQIAGSLTNRTGALTDLRFSGSSGITFASASEVASGAIDKFLQLNVEDEVSSRKHKSDKTAPEFLLDARNKITVKWGYKEDPKNVRSKTGIIGLVSPNFPENSQPTTTITCFTGKAFVDQVTPGKSVTFGRKTRTGSGFTIEVEDITTTELIQEICNKTNLDCIISDEILNETEGEAHQKVWVAGESFSQFMQKIADESNCYWDIIVDPNDPSKETLVFINKKDLNKAPIKGGNFYFKYKQPGSILKSVKINADYKLVGGDTQSSVDESGRLIKSTQSHGQKSIQLTEKEGGGTEQAIDYDPTSRNPNKAAKGLTDQLLDDNSAGRAEVNVSVDNGIDSATEAADVKARESIERAISLEFTTLGYPKLTPGRADFQNLGVRYSGAYEILTVSHIIDSTGYVCRGTATSYAVATGGLDLSEVEKTNREEETTESVQLTEPLKNLRNLTQTD